MKTGVLVNMCNKCPITSATTCSLQRIAFERYHLDGMSHCETYDDVCHMLAVMKERKSRIKDKARASG
jgi:hypothetical protein